MLTIQDRKLLLEDFKTVFATKDDLKNFATKDDFVALKAEISALPITLGLDKFATKKDHSNDVLDIMDIMFATRDELKDDIDSVLLEVKDLRKEVFAFLGHQKSM